MRLHPVPLYPLALLLVLVGPGSPAQTLPPLIENGPSYQLRAGDGRWVHPSAKDAPVTVRDFREEHGPDWKVYWDPVLRTPRCIFPLVRVPLVAPDAMGPNPDRYLLTRAAEAFLDSIADLLGTGAAQLTEPYVYPVASRWILVFGQTTPGGIPIRGANIRVVVRETGELGWVKAFLAREVPEPAAPLLERAQVVAAALDSGAEVLEAKLQVGFPGEGLPEAIPIWVLSVVEPDGGGALSERIVDARSGTILARRRVVKHFEASGVALGSSPPAGDIYASPQTGARGLRALGSIVIRDTRGRELWVTGPDGSFELGVDQNPATLVFSLEGGDMFQPGVNPHANEHGYARLLEVRPLDDLFLPFELPPGEDTNGDGVPDFSAECRDGEPALATMNAANHAKAYLFRAWWLQCYHHAMSMLRFTERMLQRFELDRPPFWPVVPLRVRPASGNLVQDYSTPNALTGGLGEIITALTFRIGLDLEGSLLQEDVLPTILLHEVGHHVFFNMTASADAKPFTLEEGIADVLTGFTTGRCHIGFKSPSEATALGFCIGSEGDPRAPLRAKVGNAFWGLQDRLLVRTSYGQPDSQPHVAAGLLLHWLAFNRAEGPDAVTFDASRSIVDELLAIDTLDVFTRQGFPCDSPCHQREVIEAFAERRFFDAPFIRGDSNTDQRLDIADAVATLNFLFGGQGSFHDCRNAMDADDDGDIRITDAIRLLQHLFQGGEELPSPYPECGLDPAEPESPENLGCFDFACPR